MKKGTAKNTELHRIRLKTLANDNFFHICKEVFDNAMLTATETICDIIPSVGDTVLVAKPSSAVGFCAFVEDEETGKYDEKWLVFGGIERTDDLAQWLRVICYEELKHDKVDTTHPIYLTFSDMDQLRMLHTVNRMLLLCKECNMKLKVG